MKIALLVLFAFCDAAQIFDPQLIQRFETEDVEKRIVGGSPVALGDIPYFAFISGSTMGIFLECGGSLIAYNWVLTAAHCMFLPTFQVEVYLGFVDRSTQPAFSSGVLFNDRYVIHPGWDFNTMANDIGLINIPSTPAILLNPFIGLIALPQTNDVNLVGQMGTVSGFGEDMTGMESNFLNAVNLNIIANGQCQTAFPGMFGGNHVCTANNGGQSFCFGDGGGPLVTQMLPARRVVVGIATPLSFDGCQQTTPGAFTRVTSYLTWIEGIIGGGAATTTTTTSTTTTTTTTSTTSTTTTTTIPPGNDNGTTIGWQTTTPGIFTTPTTFTTTTPRTTTRSDASSIVLSLLIGLSSILINLATK